VRSLTTADIERMKADIIAGKTAKPRKIEGRGGVARQPSLLKDEKLLSSRDSASGTCSGCRL